MGGEGSGRKPDLTKQFLKKEAPIVRATHDEGFVIPNHSGITSSTQATNKLDTRYVNTTGDTMTGNLTIQAGGASYNLDDINLGMTSSWNLGLGDFTFEFFDGEFTSYFQFGQGSYIWSPATGTVQTGTTFLTFNEGVAGANPTRVEIKGQAGAGTNINGAELRLTGNSSTGTGTSKVSVYVADAGASGTGANTPRSIAEFQGGASSVGTVTLADKTNIVLNTTTGTKIGTATNQKLGFFNATPIIQQTTTSQTPSTFTANTSGIVNDTATWDGYTIGDIVKILRVFGLIA